MSRRLRRLIPALVVAVALSLGAAPASAEFKTETQHAPLIFDLMIMRPAGLVFGAASAALFVPVGAVTLLVRPSEIEKPFDYLVMRPVRFVFVDPLGKH